MIISDNLKDCSYCNYKQQSSILTKIIHYKIHSCKTFNPKTFNRHRHTSYTQIINNKCSYCVDKIFAQLSGIKSLGSLRLNLLQSLDQIFPIHLVPFFIKLVGGWVDKLKFKIGSVANFVNIHVLRKAVRCKEKWKL